MKNYTMLNAFYYRLNKLNKLDSVLCRKFQKEIYQALRDCTVSNSREITKTHCVDVDYAEDELLIILSENFNSHEVFKSVFSKEFIIDFLNYLYDANFTLSDFDLACQ